MILNFFDYELSNLGVNKLFNLIRDCRDDKVKIINCINHTHLLFLQKIRNLKKPYQMHT